MTIVAVSMPVLRVFVQRAVSSAVGTYLQSSRDKSRNEKSKADKSGAEVSSHQSKRTTDSVEIIGRTSKGYLELEELVVDETTGRVTVLSREQEPIPDTPEQKESSWPLGK